MTAHAHVTHDRLRTVGGHSTYYTERDAGIGGRELARFEIPWVSDDDAAQDGNVDFDFPEDEAALHLVANERQLVTAVSYRKIALVPYIAYGVVERPPR